MVLLCQDLLILACGHPENRSSLIRMDEWPEWILEILISNHEVASSLTSIRTYILRLFSHVFLLFSFLTSIITHFYIYMQRGGSKTADQSSLKDVEDFIHNFLIIMLEHSMRQKDGWKVGHL